MKAITAEPKTPGSARLDDVPQPHVRNADSPKDDLPLFAKTLAVTTAPGAEQITRRIGQAWSPG